MTGRELVVLRALRGPLTLREIADELHLSHNTVKTHVRAVFRKLGTHSRREAVVAAGTLGLLPRSASHRPPSR
jgi:LuxR family maltose regulon positive regulatory protein